MLNRKEYIELLAHRYEKHYELKYNLVLYGFEIDLFGRSRAGIVGDSRTRRTWSREYLLVRWVGAEMSHHYVDSFARYLRSVVGGLLEDPGTGRHLIVTGVLVSPWRLASRVRERVEGIRLAGGSRWRLGRSWEVHMVLVDLEAKQVYTNQRKRPDKVLEVFLPV
ncbi:MAG: hypothetical protein H5U02_09980 [Clostridia bacterium]|nr:hypothetical protein [Clostridia bacterium]